MNNYINAQNIGIVCGVGFLAYCAYFDHKRRNAPDYRDKVRAKREERRVARENEDLIELPAADDKEGIEKFFVKEIEIGEELMQAGELDRGVRHLSYAVALCPQPQQLLSYLHEVLPTNAYKKLLENLTIANKKIGETYRRSAGSMREEDVE